MGRRLEKKARPQPSLFDPPPHEDPADEEFVEVNLQGVRFERLRDFGDVWLALGLWRLLGLDTLLAEKMPDGRQEISWAAVAAIRTIARFCEPSSELHIEEHWYARTALQKIPQSAATGPLKDLALAQRRWGRLQQRYWRAARAFEVKIVPLDPPVGKAKLKITYSRNSQWEDWAALSEGCYLLRTNLTDVDAPTLWKRYIQLTEAEWAFRITKDELVIRPIWHQKPERVKAHILVCFLAYVLWKTLGPWMRRAGLGDAPRTLLLELAKIKSGDVVLPVRRSLDKPSSGPANSPDRVVRLRCVTAPDEAQKVLLHRLGLTLPQRLRRIDEFVQM